MKQHLTLAAVEIEKQVPNAAVDVMSCDLASMASIDTFVGASKAGYPRLDLLFNNAAVMKRERTVTADGFEMMFQVNYLAPFMLMRSLLEQLRAGPTALVLNNGRPSGKPRSDFEDLQFAKRYRTYESFFRTKLCLLLATVELAQRPDGAGMEPDRLGDAGSWASAVLLLFVVPLAGTQWLIGFVIYLNHTHPEIVWYDDSTEWPHLAVQLEGPAGQRFRRFSLLPQRIMHHTAHHVDPSVPLRQLEHAQHYLVDTFGDRVVSYPWSRAVFRNILCRCKLYDYDEKRWLTYAAAEDDA